MSKRRRRPPDRLLWDDTTPDVLVDRVQVEPSAAGVLVRLFHPNPDEWVELWVTPEVLRRLLAAHLASQHWELREPA